MTRTFPFALALALTCAACAHAGTTPPAPAPNAAGTPVAGMPVVAGADRLFPEYAHLLRGKRLALLANHSARLADGTHLADALHRWPEARLRVLFGMEYDIRSNDYSLPQDPDSVIDGPTGLVKYDLYYGRTHKPTRAMLGDAQVVVVDLQDVGARFYEHINVLGLVMEAAAENGLEVVVLDRPNPIGPRQDGFVADATDLYGFGSFGPVPITHGLTMGELARFYDGERLLRGGGTVPLQVVPMKGWSHALRFDRTGLPWRRPSPNLVSLESVLAYPGTCFFEATNLSEGRGTDLAFQQVGAPWLDNLQATSLLNALALPGVAFEAVDFTPEQKRWLARPPKLSGQRLHGVRLHITDADAFQPVRAGVALLWAVHRLHPDKLEWKDDVLRRLAATPRLKAMIEEGRTPQEIFAAWGPEVEAFRARSAKYRLYD